MDNLSDKLKSVNKPKGHKKGPMWDGPSVNSQCGGISYSLLSRYLSCEERFRLMMIEGLRPKDRFNHLLEFGSLWHAAEEGFAGKGKIGDMVTSYAKKLTEKYPFQREEIRHWHDCCLALFPIYMDYWKRHKDVTSRKPLIQERVFNVEYRLPSGRIVRLRSKLDSVDLVENKEDRINDGVWLQENKTKSGIDQVKIERQLKFDLQTMIYLIVLHTDRYNKPLVDLIPKGTTIRGVRYNVVRRSSHKSPESMIKKCIEDIGADRGAEWFSRWNTEISGHDIEVFKHQCFHPVLENLCDDYEWWQYCKMTGVDVYLYLVRSEKFPEHQKRHYRHPFGVYNVLDEGGSADLDHYLDTGSEVGLQRTDNFFPELN